MRLPLGGGGTDLASYYSKFGGFFVSAAIDKHNYLAVKDRFENGFRVSYSTTEITDNVDSIKQPLVREALKLLNINDSLEIVSIADVPGRSGLGGSSSYTVGVLNALHAFKRENVSRQTLAEEACHIEIDLLKESIGKQDQYVASFGGINSYEIERDGTVNVRPLAISSHGTAELENNLLLFYTGIKRDASQILGRQKQDQEKGDKRVIDTMHEIKRIGYQVRDSLANGDIRNFGELLDLHWRTKKNLSEQISNSRIDQLYELAMRNGAIGGKVCFSPETMIKTEDGYKPVKEVREGDRVCDHRNVAQRVLRVFKRHHKGVMLEFTVKGLDNKIGVTPEHPIFTTMKHPGNQREGRKIVNLPIFREARDFRKGDVFLIPIDDTAADLEYVDFETVIEPSKFSNNDIYENIPRKLKVGWDLLNLLGWYIAEGSRSRKEFFLTLNGKEMPIAEEILENISQLFSKEAVIAAANGAASSIIVRCSSIVLSQFFDDLCGSGATNKHLPNFVMKLPLEKQFIMLRALWRGDGCLRTVFDKRYGGRSPVCNFKTVSFTLAKQVQQLCLRLGYLCSIRSEQSRECYIANNRKPSKTSIMYNVTLHGDDAAAFIESISRGSPVPVSRSNQKHVSQKKEFVEIDGIRYAKRTVLKIEEKNYEGDVFNLDVENSHTYVAEDVAVHNCGAGGGGFFMFYVENNKEKLRNVMAREGLKELRFRFDFDGSKTLLNL